MTARPHTRARFDDGSEFDHAGHVDRVERLLLILHAGQVDDDRLALDTDIGLGDPLVLELAADQVADDDQIVTGRRLDGRQDDRHAALEVETEDRRVARWRSLPMNSTMTMTTVLISEAQRRRRIGMTSVVGDRIGRARRRRRRTSATSAALSSSSSPTLPWMAARAMRICTSSSISSQNRFGPSSPVTLPKMPDVVTISSPTSIDFCNVLLLHERDGAAAGS